jgi:hypothetical protein
MNTNTMDYKRNGKTWTVNECLKLEREYDLLELSIYEIAKLHQRTPRAIMNRLDKEGFVSYQDLYTVYPEMIPGTTNGTGYTNTSNNNINSENIQNETLQEIVSLLDMQKNMTSMQSQIDNILSVINKSYNNAKSRFI